MIPRCFGFVDPKRRFKRFNCRSWQALNRERVDPKSAQLVVQASRNLDALALLCDGQLDREKPNHSFVLVQ
jgi:hypothetical protein